jgi:hypothetical protein
MEEQFAVMVEGKQTPSKLYEDYESATSEATRLARQERRDVYVLKVVAKAEISDVKITKF